MKEARDKVLAHNWNTKVVYRTGLLALCGACSQTVFHFYRPHTKHQQQVVTRYSTNAKLSPKYSFRSHYKSWC